MRRLMNFDEELAALSKEFTELREENARLKAEVERLRASSFVTAVPVEEYEKLKAEVEDLNQKLDHTKTLLVRATSNHA